MCQVHFKHFTLIISFNLHNKKCAKGPIIITPFYRGGNGGTENVVSGAQVVHWWNGDFQATSEALPGSEHS